MGIQQIPVCEARPAGRTARPNTSPNTSPNISNVEHPTTERHIHIWRGASGRSYRHWIFPLLWCPELPRANYVLVRRHGDASRTPLAIGHTICEAATLNLAELRRQGAILNANEVHIHIDDETPETRAAIARDLRAGQSH